MQQKNQIKYTPAAIDDMDEIFSYISHDNVTAAESLLENGCKITCGISLEGKWMDFTSCT
ncbi:hypothetical protein AB3Z07_01830 [Metabacillus halosaccharovorans]|uniref:hypothetical protein n=1 Tax=Metabacillus halosaccharovorans TaxID=930124 RepID=UPI0034D004F9